MKTLKNTTLKSLDNSQMTEIKGGYSSSSEGVECGVCHKDHYGKDLRGRTAYGGRRPKYDC